MSRLESFFTKEVQEKWGAVVEAEIFSSGVSISGFGYDNPLMQFRYDFRSENETLEDAFKDVGELLVSDYENAPEEYTKDYEYPVEIAGKVDELLKAKTKMTKEDLEEAVGRVIVEYVVDKALKFMGR